MAGVDTDFEFTGDSSLFQKDWDLCHQIANTSEFLPLWILIFRLHIKSVKITFIIYRLQNQTVGIMIVLNI